MNFHAEPPPDSGDQFDLATLPDGAIHQLVINEWLRCFQKNGDFKAYCDAKRTGDDETCLALEAKHERIAELYTDWGDIHALPSMSDADSFTNWFDSKAHLFPFPEAQLFEVDDFLSHLARNDTALVEIPKGLKKKQLLDVLADFVGSHPELLGDGAKYEIKQVKGESLLNTWKRLRRAETAYGIVSVIGPILTSEKKSLPGKAVKAILRTQSANRTLEFDWYLHGELNQKLFEQNKLPADEIKNYTRTINSLNKFYQDCIDGTIRGTFPAAS